VIDVSFLTESLRLQGDNPPSHTIVNQSAGNIAHLVAEVSYAGALACATLANATGGDLFGSKSATGLPWFELRTTAVGISACSTDLDCELNGKCGSDKQVQAITARCLRFLAWFLYL